MTLAKAILKQDYQVPTFPTGWFVIALSNEVKKGEILSRTFSGKDVVIFRTESGKAAVLDAYCPHMGAHFAHGGSVEGEDIKCPFHGFCFNTDGECTKTGYGTKPSPRAKSYSWPVDEKMGVIFCWYHPEQIAPTYHIDTMESDEFTDFKIHTWEMISNPTETAENSVDVGHFSHIHGYKDPHSINPLKLDGPFLNVKYGMYRNGDFIGKPKKNFLIEFEIFQQGLGFALVEAHTIELGVKTRHLVMPTTIAGKEMYLRIGCAVGKIKDPGKIMPILKILPKSLITKIMHREAFKGYIHDVYQDFKVWQNKIYLTPPALSKGDGPIMQYRAWAAQFDYELNQRVNANIEDN
ncbi:MAG: Rieske 2Fe-2S domain-containing protein [Chitinophagales bacterium]